MKRSDAPSKQPVPFGVNGTRESLLATAQPSSARASYDAGFPPITMTAKASGGLPPKGPDFNQILYELSDLGRWGSAGALQKFDATFSTAIGGYPEGSLILSDDNSSIYISIVDDNTINPNSGTTGWENLGKLIDADNTLRTELASSSDGEGAALVNSTQGISIQQFIDQQFANSRELFLNQIPTLRLLSAQMHAGISFNITCYGDSTTAGVNTTSYVANPTENVTGFPWTTAPIANSDQNANAPNAWPIQLQYILREYHKNTSISVYNAGYSGQQMANGWANYYFDKAVLGNPYIPNPNIVFIGFGLNDTTEAGNVIQKHISETIDVIKKVLAAGATPVVLTCDTNWRSYPHWSSSSSGRDNEEVAAQIDQAKHYMCQVFGVPIIDMDHFEKQWITTNSEGDTLAYLQSDALHFNDLGNQMKAGIIGQHFMPDIFRTNGTSIERMDWKDSRSKFQFGYQDSYIPTSGDKGGNYSRFPTIWYLGTDDYVASDLVMDTWIWSEGDQPSLIYRSYGNGNIDSTYTLAQLPNITINWLSNSTPYYNQPIPACGYNDAYASPTDRPYFIQKLKYGLNRVRLYCPSVVQNIFWGGWFELNPKWKSKTTTDWLNNINEPSFIQSDALEGIGPLYLRFPADTTNTQVAFMFPERHDGGNIADFGQIGDIVDVIVSGYFDTSTGFLLFGGRSINRNSGSTDNSQQDNCLMVYCNSTTTCQLMQLRYPLQATSPYPVIQSGNASSFTDQNRTMLIRIQRTGITTQTVTIYNGTSDNGTVALSYTGGWSSGAFSAAGIIGGVYVNRSSTRTINITQCLVRKYR